MARNIETGFVVIDEDGVQSWSAKNEEAEVFQTEACALKRARELAGSSPGKVIRVFRHHANVHISVAPKAETVFV